MTTFRNLGMGVGLVLAIIGIVLFVFPSLSLTVFATIVGLGIMFSGASATIAWAQNLRGTGQGTGALIAGILSIVFGFICIMHPIAFAEALTWIVAVAVIVFAVAQIIGLLTTPDIDGRLIGVIGNLVVILCGVFAFVWPPFIMQFIGASLLIEGITTVVVSLTLPKA